MQALPDRVANAVQEQPRVSQPEADHARIVQLNAITQCPLCGGLDSRVAFREANPFGPPFREALYNSALFPNLRFAPPTMAGGKERVFAHALALFRAHGLRGRLFDAGCGNGRFLMLARPLFESVTGVDTHRDNVRLARKHGLDVECDGIREALSGLLHRRFDVVTLFDVLEHLPDPVAHLVLLKSVLAPRGYLYVKVPHLRMQLAKERVRVALGRRRGSLMGNFAHINHFSEHSLARALRRLDFDVVHIGPAPSDFDSVSGHIALTRSAARAVRMTGFAAVRAVKAVTSVNVGMHLEVLARRAA